MRGETQCRNAVFRKRKLILQRTRRKKQNSKKKKKPPMCTHVCTDISIHNIHEIRATYWHARKRNESILSMCLNLSLERGDFAIEYVRALGGVWRVFVESCAVRVLDYFFIHIATLEMSSNT